MKKTVYCFLAMLFFILTFFSLQPLTAADNENEFARWNELKDGQEGYMDSVFKGTEIKRIKVKYIGTTPHPASRGERAIVIELIDKYIPEGSTAVAGTSGSPIYFEVRGKLRLVGAAAFMFNDFPKNGTIMGVTPIEAMIDGATPTRTRRTNTLPTIIMDAHYGTLKIRWLPITFDKMELSSMTDKDGQPIVRRPKAGDSVTVMLSPSQGAICTVTYVTENRFWACGHSILESSDEQVVSFQSYRTQITITLFSAHDSYKMFSGNLELFGKITKNSPFAISGEIAATPQK